MYKSEVGSGVHPVWKPARTDLSLVDNGDPELTLMLKVGVCSRQRPAGGDLTTRPDDCVKQTAAAESNVFPSRAWSSYMRSMALR